LFVSLADLTSIVVEMDENPTVRNNSVSSYSSDVI
jgi:hypothetical protein